jgi:peptide/nickel transport system substrate-binding protein
MIDPSAPYKPRRLAVVTTILLLFVLAVQACAPAATPSPASPTSAPSEVQTSPEAPTSPEPPSSPTDTQVAAPTQAPEASPTAMEPSGGGSASQAGTLRVAMQPIVQTDPAFISSDSEVLVANHVYDYLVDINPDSEIIPRLAKSWTTSDDGLTYVFELNEGVTFHDSSPFSAADVVWTFDRLRDPSQDLPTKDLYANIDTIEATGDLEVTFTLKQPNPFFLYDLSDNHALILKADTQDPTDFNGTGPFVVQNYSPEDRISMVANENYFVEGEPMLAGLDIIFFNDEAASVDALRSGQVDLAMRMSISLFQSLQGDPNITTIDIPTNGFDLVRLRSDRAPGNDPKVMQAFKLATDRQAIFQLVQQGFGAIGSDTPIGPLYKEYYDPAYQPPARDVEAARQLLSDAGYPNGLDIDMHVPDTGGRPDLAVVLKNQWAEAGINVNVIVEPESVYYGDNGWLEVDLGITGWGSRPYPQFYLDTMLTCNAIWNEAHFCDPEFDQLAMTAGTTLDDQARKDAYDQIQQLLVDRGPIIIPYFFAQVAAINNNFQNFELKAFAGRTDFRQVSSTP